MDVPVISGLQSSDPAVVARKVQSMFLEVMLKSMEESVGAEDGLFGGSSTSEVYRSMFREQLADSISAQLGPGLTDELERAMRQRRASSVESSPAPVEPSVRSSVPSMLPVDGVITSGVGWRMDPLTGASRYHKGMDIAAPEGSEVRSIDAGTVIESRIIGAYGYAVVVQADDGRKMLYGHNSRNLVEAGDRVVAGTPIALVGSTGRATGPHVHFEVIEP